jgi:hypothetical protein
MDEAASGDFEAMTLNTAYPMAFLLGRLLDEPRLLTPAQAADINESSRNLLIFTREEDGLNRQLLNAALSGMLQTYEEGPAQTRQCVVDALEEGYLRTAGHVVLPILAQHAKRLVSADPELLKSLYAASFGFEETSEESTVLGGPVLAMGTNRKQEVEHARWALGQLYRSFLEARPDVATRALMAALELDGARTRPASHRKRAEFSFEFDSRTVRFVEDGSGIREQFGVHDTVGEMLQTWEAHVENVTADKRADLEEIVTAVAQVKAPAAAWLKLLRAGARNPDVVGERLRMLCWQPAILLSPDTNRAGREFLESQYPRLQQSERATVDQAVLGMLRVAGYGDKKRLKYLRELILGRLRKEDIVTPKFAALHAKFADKSQEPAGPVFGFGVGSFGDWSGQDAGQKDPLATELSELARPVSDFVFAHLNSAPAQSSARSVLPQARALYHFLRRQSEPGPQERWGHVKRQLAEACAILGRAQSASIAAQVRDLVLPMARDNDPVQSQEADDNLAERGYPMVSGVRGHVAVALGRITPQLKDDAKVRRALVRLASDPVAGVRREVVAHLAPVVACSPGWAWRLIGERASKESNNGVLLTLLQFTLARLANEPNSERVSALVTPIYYRAQGVGAKALRKQCTGLFLNLSFNFGDRSARNALDRISGHPLECSAEIAAAAFELRGWLVSDGTPKLDDIAARAWEFLTACVSAAQASRVTLDAEYAAYKDGSGGSLQNIQNNYEALGSVVDAIGNALFFASGAFEGVGMSQGKRETRLTAEQQKEFLSSAGPAIESLAGFGLPTVAHHLAEICEAYLDVDPRGTLLLLARIVRAGRSYRYESDQLAAGLMVRLIERYLAEYRHLLRGDNNLQSALREILETFVGWPAALQLIYRLDDVFC